MTPAREKPAMPIPYGTIPIVLKKTTNEAPRAVSPHVNKGSIKSSYIGSVDSK